MPSKFENFIGRTPGQGERPLDSVTLGNRYYFPDREAKERIAGYARVEDLLDPDKHVELRKQENQTGLVGDRDTDRFWIGIDFPGMLGRLMRHYAVGRDFRAYAKLRGELPSGAEDRHELQSEAQDIVDRISKASCLPRLLRQMAETVATHGDAVMRVDVVDMENPDTGRKEPTARARFVKPGYYFPQLSPIDASTVTGVELAWVFPVPPGLMASGLIQEMATGSSPPGGTDVTGGAGTAHGLTISGNQMVLREVHQKGSIEYKLNLWDGKKVGPSLSVAAAFPGLEDSQTGIDEIPVLHVGNAVRGGEHFGNSEVLRVQQLVMVLEQRLSQEDEVLEKHARPKLIVGPGLLDDEGRANLEDFDVIEVEPDVMEKAVKPEYLTWDMQLAGIQHEIEKLEEYLFMTTETSPASFGLERDGSQVESARALRFKAHRTVNKVMDLRDAFKEMLDAFFRIAQKLELAKRKASNGNGYRRTNVVVEFGDPILEDKEQEVLDYVAQKGVNLVSTRRAVQDLHDLTDEQAEREVGDILQDMVNEAASGASTREPLGPEGGGGPSPGTPVGSRNPG